MLIPSLSASARAEAFVDSLVRAFGEGLIAQRTECTLKSVFTAALLVTENDLNRAGLPFPMDSIRVAAVLLAMDGDDAGVRLAGELAARAAMTNPETADGAELRGAVQGLAPLYGSHVTAGQRWSQTESARSKVSALLDTALM